MSYSIEFTVEAVDQLRMLPEEVSRAVHRELGLVSVYLDEAQEISGEFNMVAGGCMVAYVVDRNAEVLRVQRVARGS